MVRGAQRDTLKLDNALKHTTMNNDEVHTKL